MAYIMGSKNKVELIETEVGTVVVRGCEMKENGKRVVKAYKCLVIR